MTDDLVFLGAARQAELIRTKQASPVELLRAYLDRIDRLDDRLRAYITVTREAAQSRLLGPLVQRLFGGRRMELVLSVLGGGDAPKPEELAQVRALLDRLERERGD